MSCSREKRGWKKGENRYRSSVKNTTSGTSVNSYSLCARIKISFICVFCRHIVVNFCVCKMFQMNNEK